MGSRVPIITIGATIKVLASMRTPQIRMRVKPLTFIDRIGAQAIAVNN